MRLLSPPGDQAAIARHRAKLAPHLKQSIPGLVDFPSLPIAVRAYAAHA